MTEQIKTFEDIRPKSFWGFVWYIITDVYHFYVTFNAWTEEYSILQKVLIFILSPIIWIRTTIFREIPRLIRIQYFPTFEDELNKLPYEEKQELGSQVWSDGERIPQPEHGRLWIKAKLDDEGNPIGWILPLFFGRTLMMDVRGKSFRPKVKPDGMGGVYLYHRETPIGNVRITNTALARSFQDRGELLEEYYIGGTYGSVLPQPQHSFFTQHGES